MFFTLHRMIVANSMITTADANPPIYAPVTSETEQVSVFSNEATIKRI